jgi:hypothetical protein
MRRASNHSSREFFEHMYAANADPWAFSSDPYELSRYEEITAALSGQSFACAFEPGCSVGVLTERLSPFCEELLAIDLSAIAVRSARTRCAVYQNVCIQQGSVAEVDPGPLDLLVLSEIGYYFTVFDLKQWSNRLLSRLRPGGTLLACHWLGSSTDHVLSGDQVHEVFDELARNHQYALKLERRTDNFRLNKWIRAHEAKQH